MRRVVVLLALAAWPVGAEEAGVELVRGAAPELRVKQSAALSLSIVPRAGHRLLADGPLQIRLHGDGVRAARPLYLRDDAVDARADVPRFELAVTAERAGRARVDADCTFYLCTAANRCRAVETTASWELTIAP